MKLRNGLICAGLALLLPAAASAQAEEGSWSVDLVGGVQMYPEASALTTGAALGVEALYQLTPRIAIGPAAQYSRTSTDETFFVAVLDFGADSTRVFQVGQRINSLNYGGVVRFDLMPDNTLNPYVTGGGGLYTLYLEPQPNDEFSRVTEPMFQVGGGIRYAVSEAAGIQLDVRDIVYTNYDRELVNPIQPRHRNRQVQPDGSVVVRFPEAERDDIPDNEETLHNLRFSIGLTYVPSLNR